jgi:hypothetical protein
LDQRFCGDAVCRKASKTESQQKWKRKAENLRYWRGDKIFAELAVQRGKGEDLPHTPNGDKKLPEDPVIVGILAVLCSSTSKGSIERTYRNVLVIGRDILRRQR